MAYNGKPLLFYSNMCHHSKRLLSRIGPTNLVNNLNFICIDDPRIKIPEIIQSVPTLFDPSIGRPISDNELFGWVESVLGGSRGNQSPQQQQFGGHDEMQQPQHPNQGGMGQPQYHNQGSMGQPQYPNQGGMGMQQQYPNQGGMNPGGGMSNMDPRKKTEEMLQTYQGMVSMGNGNVNMADITGDASITAFQPNEMIGSGNGTGYSFIDNDAANETLSGSFIRLDGQGNEDEFKNKNSHLVANITKANSNNIPGQGNSGGSGGMGRTQLDNDYDRLLMERNSEMQNSMGAMRH